MIAIEPWTQGQEDERIRSKTVRLWRDGELIVCAQYAPNKGFICVNGQPDYQLTLEWVEER